jgi:hypothetical protein
MSYKIADFTGQTVQSARKWNAKHYANIVAELNAIATALNTDVSSRDMTITLPPPALKPDKKTQTPFTNEILLIVNRGKGGNLTPLAMSNAITAELSKIFPPVNTAAPAVTGTGTVGQTLTCTQGNWTYAPTSYAYQWLRNGANISGATAATYVLAAADSTKSVSCRVTASNAAGSTPIVSNAVAVA